MRAATNGDGPGRGAWFATALAAGAMGGLVCGVIVSFSGERELRATTPGVSTNDALVQQLRSLGTELSTLREELERSRLAELDTGPAAVAPTALVPPAPGAVDVTALSAALDRLAQQLAHVPQLQPPQLDPVKRQQLRPVDDTADDLPEHDDEYWDRQHEERRLEHLLWTADQLLATYGRPDEVYTGEQGRSTWVYNLAPESCVTFIFVQDRVIEVY